MPLDDKRVGAWQIASVVLFPVAYIRSLDFDGEINIEHCGVEWRSLPPSFAIVMNTYVGVWQHFFHYVIVVDVPGLLPPLVVAFCLLVGFDLWIVKGEKKKESVLIGPINHGDWKVNAVWEWSITGKCVGRNVSG